MEEIWKDIQGLEGRYQVSSTGRIRSLNYRRQKRIKVLKPRNDGRGYYSVTLDKKNYKVHRLVAIHFVDGYKPGLVVNHLNEIRTDNRQENLAFCTRGENILYSFNIHGSKKTGRQVKQYDSKGRFLALYRSAKDASRILNIPYKAFLKALNKNRCLRKGYLFQFEED